MVDMTDSWSVSRCGTGYWHVSQYEGGNILNDPDFEEPAAGRRLLLFLLGLSWPEPAWWSACWWAESRNQI